LAIAERGVAHYATERGEGFVLRGEERLVVTLNVGGGEECGGHNARMTRRTADSRARGRIDVILRARGVDGMQKSGGVGGETQEAGGVDCATSCFRVT